MDKGVAGDWRFFPVFFRTVSHTSAPLNFGHELDSLGRTPTNTFNRLNSATTSPQHHLLPVLRKLILAQVVTFILSIPAALFESRVLPPALRDHRASAMQHPFSFIDGIEIVAWCVAGVLTIMGLVALWRGRPWGFRIYLASWLLGLALALFGHPTVASAVAMTLATLSGLLGGAILGVQYSSGRHIQSPSNLADAVTAAITYISATPADNDRADDDVRVLESLTVTLRRCSASERNALRAVVEKARVEATSLSGARPDVLETFNAIERDILDTEPQ